MSMKLCAKCNILQSTDQFFKRSDTKCGLSSHCKKCLKIKSRLFNTSEKGKIVREKNKKEMYKRHPEQTLAIGKVYTALKNGLLIKKPCEVCGNINGIHGHHDDYTKPLDVIWLCSEHHRERHRYLKSINHDFKKNEAKKNIRSKYNAEGTYVRKYKTHCKRGHEMIEGNYYQRKSGVRNCRKCRDIIDSISASKVIYDFNV